MIRCSRLSKDFRLYEKKPGVTGAIASLFSRSYSIKTAVKGFDLDISKGEFVGLLGPNGAGKTTLMKMLTGIIVPSCGELEVNGYIPFKRHKEFRKKIALVMGQKSQLWWDIPAYDSFVLLQKYYEIPEDKFQKRLNDLSSTLGVTDLLQVHVRKLSLGERMKMELIASILHNPDVMFLDEPTIGLDLSSQVKIREFLLDYQKQHGTTIVLTSHYMADVIALCQRIVLITDGEKKFDGPIEDFEKLLGNEKHVEFVFSKKMDINDDFWSYLDVKWSTDCKKVELRVEEEKLRKISSEILQKFPVVDFYTEKLPIERVMHSLMDDPRLLEVRNNNE